MVRCDMSEGHISPPGEFIRQELEKRGWGQADLAQILGRPLPTINEIIQGKKAIMPEMAVALGVAFGTGPEVWMQREAQYRLSLVERDSPDIERRARMFALAPVKDMERRGWIKKTESADALEVELRRFFEVDDLASEPVISATARQSTGAFTLTAPQKAWCFRAKKLARSVQAARFDESTLAQGVVELRKLAAFPESVKEVPKVLGQLGVRFVVIEHLPESRIDGAAFWLDAGSPVIALSIRYDRIDGFWHTLFHELAHIRHWDSISVDDALVGESRIHASLLADIEARAEADAADALIAKDKLRSFIIRVKPYYSKTRLIQFAHRMGVHPGIVAGQLQHLGEISYATNREMLAKIRDLATSTALTDGWGKVAPAL